MQVVRQGSCLVLGVSLFLFQVFCVERAVAAPVAVSVPQASSRGDEDFAGKKEPIDSVHSLIISAPDTWSSRTDFHRDVSATITASGIQDLRVAKITQQSVAVRAPSLQLMNKVRSLFTGKGLIIESDPPIRSLLFGNPNYVADPAAPVWYYQPTEVARGAPSSSPVAFDYTMGSPAVRVMVIDTPLDQFEAGLWGTEMLPPTTPLSPSTGLISHGTPVSYFIHGFANGYQSFGICPGCTRQFSDIDVSGAVGTGLSLGLLSDAIARIDSKIRTTNPAPDILSLSWGLPLESQALGSVIRSAQQRGITVVAAAGNEALPYPLFPASAPYVIGVGSSGEQQAQGFNPLIMSNFSNRGVDIVAPGNRVVFPDATDVNVGFYEGAGTSFATPYVAGSLGLLQSYYRQNPTDFAYVAQMSPVQRSSYFTGLLLENTKDIEAPGVDTQSGHGLVNPRLAIEALIADGNAERTALSPGLSRGVSEWGASRRIIDEAKHRIEQKSPLTKMVINVGPYEYGSCWQSQYNYTKINVGRPRLNVSLHNTTYDVTSSGNDEIDVSVQTQFDYSGYARLKVTTGVQCVLLLPSAQMKLTYQLAPRAGSNPVSTFKYKYRLKPQGYELISSSATTPELDIVLGLDNTPATIDQFLPSIRDEVGEELMSAVSEYLAAPVRGHFSYMVDKILEASLPQERKKPFAYNYARTVGGVGADQEYRMSIKDVGFLNSADHPSKANRSRSEIRAARPTGLPIAEFPPLVNAALVVPNPQDESEVTTPHNVYNVQLAHLYAKGAFDGRSDAEYDNLNITSGTTLSPGGVFFGFQNIAATTPPVLFAESPGLPGGNPLRVTTFYRGHVTVGMESGDATIVYSVPVTAATMFKGKDIETDTMLQNATYEERLIPDHTEAEVYFVFDDSELEGRISSYATPADLGNIFDFTYGMKTIRRITGLSASRNALNVNLGAKWGCFGHIAQFVNYWYRQVATSSGATPRDLIEVTEEKECIDLNIGYFAPSHTPSFTHTTSATTAAISFIPREEILEPRAKFSNAIMPFVDSISHNGAIVEAHTVVVNVVPDGPATSVTEPAGEVQVSVNGIFRTPFSGAGSGVKNTERVTLVEQLWQLRGSRGSRTHPTILVPNKGTSEFYSILGIGRNVKELTRQKECFPLLKIKFYYANGGIPPTFHVKHGGALKELSVLEKKDQWGEGSCTGSSWVPDGAGTGQSGEYSKPLLYQVAPGDDFSIPGTPDFPQVIPSPDIRSRSEH